MKITTTLVMALAMVLTKPSFSQTESDNFLKSYQAPDFRYRSLAVNLNGFGTGSNTFTSNEHDVLGLMGLQYSQWNNSAGHQGTMNAKYGSNILYRKRDDDTFFSTNNGISLITSNRFYFRSNWFIGLHDNSRINLNTFKNPAASQTLLSMQTTPGIAIGYGRLEPIQYARQAIDIERSLEKSGRLTEPLTAEQRIKLANQIAQLQNRRFFDVRLGRIERMEEMDRLLSGMGIISESDMTYFAVLADAYQFAYRPLRQRGFRIEAGFSQNYGLGTSQGDVLGEQFSAGYVAAEHHIPISFAMQSSLKVSVLGGLDGSAPLNADANFPLWLDASYEFGFYPTTRTYVAPRITVGMYQQGSTLGYSGGIGLSAYYYLSPRLRFQLNGTVMQGEDYERHEFYHLVNSNVQRGAKALSYDVRAGFQFAIF